MIYEVDGPAKAWVVAGGVQYEYKVYGYMSDDVQELFAMWYELRNSIPDNSVIVYRRRPEVTYEKSGDSGYFKLTVRFAVVPVSYGKVGTKPLPLKDGSYLEGTPEAKAMLAKSLQDIGMFMKNI